MDYNMIEQVKKFHLDNDYVVRVGSDGKNKLTVNYPGNILRRPHLMPFGVVYDLSESDVLSKTSSDDSKDIKIECLNYAKRPVVLADMVIEFIHRELAEELLYHPDMGELGFLDMKDLMPSPQESKLENKMLGILEKMLSNDAFYEDVDKDIENGYEILCKILNIGGI